MEMQLNRDYTLVSLSGLSVQFRKDTPTHVPKRLIQEVIALGGTASENSKNEVEQVKAAIAAEKVKMADERREKIISLLSAQSGPISITS